MTTVFARLARLALAVAVLVGMVSAARLSLPSPAFACSCVAPQPGARAFDGSEAAVFVGRVGPDDGSGIYPFAVERWYRGGDAASIRLASATLRTPDGGFSTNSCGVSLEPGSHLVLAAFASEGIYTPNSCSPLAEVDSAAGQGLVRDAVAVFGQGVAPGVPPPEEAPAPAIDLAFVAILLVVGLVVVVLFGGLLAVFGRRTRAGP